MVSALDLLCRKERQSGLEEVSSKLALSDL